jgi:hypothetical protein
MCRVCRVLISPGTWSWGRLWGGALDDWRRNPPSATLYKRFKARAEGDFSDKVLSECEGSLAAIRVGVRMCGRRNQAYARRLVTLEIRATSPSGQTQRGGAAEVEHFEACEQPSTFTFTGISRYVQHRLVANIISFRCPFVPLKDYHVMRMFTVHGAFGTRALVAATTTDLAVDGWSASDDHNVATNVGVL